MPTRQALFTVSLYLILTFSFSWVFWYPIIVLGDIQQVYYYNVGLMWMPGAAALVTARVARFSITQMGWHWPSQSHLWTAYWVPLAYIAAAYSLIWVFGLGIFPNPHIIRFWMENYGWKASSPTTLVLWHSLLTATIGVLSCCINTLGEEIGWRGFLVPVLYPRFSYTKTSLIVGLCWAVWHGPILFFANYNNGTKAPLWLGACCFAVLTVSLSFVYTWLRLKSSSLWPCVLFHSAHNMFIQALFSPLTQNTPATPYWSDEFGLLVPLAAVITGYLFWRRRRELPSQL